MIKVPAEWEEQQFLLVIFPHKSSDWVCCFEEAKRVYIELIEAVANFQSCVVICDNTSNVEPLLSSHKNIKLVEAPTNDTWARDIAAITIRNKGNIELLNFGFNGWGGKYEASLDNRVNSSLAKSGVYSSKMSSFKFVLEGGAIESDGDGALMSTTSCLLNSNRNSSYSQVDIEEFLHNHLGVKRFLWLKHGKIVGDDTNGHIDTLARFINENSIIYQACFDESDEHFEELKLMERELKAFRTKNGKPYNLYPLPLPKAKYGANNERLPATYANYVLINRAVIIPAYNDEKDAEVLELFKKLFPKREAIAIDSSTLIAQHGSLHCTTMNFF